MNPAAILALALLQGDAATSPARELLDKAEKLASEERFQEAIGLYQRLAERFPDTAEGAIGARRSQPSAFLGWADIVRHGPSSNRVDVVLMGDGYTLGHQKAFGKLAEDIPRLFERQRTFRSYWSYLNFLRANLVSADDGVDGFGREYDTALDARTLATFSGHVGIDRGKARAMLAEIPGSDGLAIVYVKLGVSGTGGGGIAVIGGMSASTTIHEWGHAFGGLSDEYDTRQSHGSGITRSGINVSVTEDPERVPWKHWLDAKHPSVGLYEGAGQRVRGAWRPTASGCVMMSGEFFCPVCQEALVLRIYSLVDPIDEMVPPELPEGIREPLRVDEEPVELRVRVMQPEKHDLEVHWWVVPVENFPQTGPGPSTGSGPGAGPAPTPGDGPHVTPPPREPERPKRGRYGDRRDRGPLAPMEGKPFATTRPDRDGWHDIRLKRSEIEPGRYKIVVRVRDTTLIPQERWPLVLKDEHGLLESERTWWAVVVAR